MALLDVVDVSKIYRSRSRGEVRALDGVTFRLDAGEVVGLLGANGAGKTTTIKSVCGLVRPTAGAITIDGIDALAHRRQAASRLTAVLEGNRTVYWRLNVRENLEFFAALRGISARAARPVIDELVTRFSLDSKKETPAMQLSRGMQQKLALACAVLPGTPLLLLDEPTLGLDVSTSHELRGYLRGLAQEDGRGVLLSSHDMQVVREVCDRVVIVNGGRVVADDTIDGLVQLFKARAVRVTLDEPLTEQAAIELRTAFEVVHTVDAVTIEVALRESRDLYVLTDRLRAAGRTIEALATIEPDLEEIFLKIVSSGVRR
jgi:ABC-2 type transport system ATP-binding protein